MSKERRKVHLMFMNVSELMITTPYFQKLINISGPLTKAIDLIGLRAYDKTIVARLKSDFYAEIHKEKNSVSLEIIACTGENKFEAIGSLENTDGEGVFEVSIETTAKKTYYKY